MIFTEGSLVTPTADFRMFRSFKVGEIYEVISSYKSSKTGVDLLYVRGDWKISYGGYSVRWRPVKPLSPPQISETIIRNGINQQLTTEKSG